MIDMGLVRPLARIAAELLRVEAERADPHDDLTRAWSLLEECDTRAALGCLTRHFCRANALGVPLQRPEVEVPLWLSGIALVRHQEEIARDNLVFVMAALLLLVVDGHRGLERQLARFGECRSTLADVEAEVLRQLEHCVTLLGVLVTAREMEALVEAFATSYREARALLDGPPSTDSSALEELSRVSGVMREIGELAERQRLIVRSLGAPVERLVRATDEATDRETFSTLNRINEAIAKDDIERFVIESQVLAGAGGRVLDTSVARLEAVWIDEDSLVRASVQRLHEDCAAWLELGRSSARCQQGLDAVDRLVSLLRGVAACDAADAIALLRHRWLSPQLYQVPTTTESPSSFREQVLERPGNEALAVDESIVAMAAVAAESEGDQAAESEPTPERLEMDHSVETPTAECRAPSLRELIDVELLDTRSFVEWLELNSERFGGQVSDALAVLRALADTSDVEIRARAAIVLHVLGAGAVSTIVPMRPPESGDDLVFYESLAGVGCEQRYFLLAIPTRCAREVLPRVVVEAERVAKSLGTMSIIYVSGVFTQSVCTQWVEILDDVALLERSSQISSLELPVFASTHTPSPPAPRPAIAADREAVESVQVDAGAPDEAIPSDARAAVDTITNQPPAIARWHEVVRVCVSVGQEHRQRFARDVATLLAQRHWPRHLRAVPEEMLADGPPPELAPLWRSVQVMGRDLARVVELLGSPLLPKVASLIVRGTVSSHDWRRFLEGALHHLSALSLERADLGDQGVGGLLLALQTTKLRRLAVIDDEVTADGLQSLNGMWKRQLELLRLRSVGLGPREARILAGASALRGVETLDMSGNNLGDDGTREIAKSRTLCKLRELRLARNSISDRGVRELACSNAVSSLRVLDLGSNRVSGSGARALCRSHHLRVLRMLDVSGNRNLSAADVTRLRGRFQEVEW